MSHHNFCCAHPQQRIDSPEPPARPPLTIDSIFAAAALPEDHPHALKFSEKLKPEVPSTSILRSPSIANKIKSQFRRKSLKALRSEEQYDTDARLLTSTEAVHNVGHGLEDTVDEAEFGIPLQRFGSVRVLETPLGRNFEEDVRSSVFGRLDWLRPLMSRTSDFTPTRSESIVDIATRVAARRGAADDLVYQPPTALSKVPQSLSSPNLLARPSRTAKPLRRTQSFFGLSSMLTVPKTRLVRTSSSESSWPDSLPKSNSLQENVLPQVDGAGSDSVVAADSTAATAEPTTASEQPLGKHYDEPEDDRASHLSDRVHLHRMDISQQLRSMSAMSDDVGETGSLLAPRNMWNFHRRERSDIGGLSYRSRHSNKHSVTGVQDDALIPARVRSPAASSIYSRPSSIVGPIGDKKDGAPYEITNQLDGALADWPLQPAAPPAVVDDLVESATPSKPNEAGPGGSATVPTEQVTDTPSTTFASAAHNHSSSVRWLSPRGNDASIQSKYSSSNLTTSSKRSRFLERFSPPKRSVKKRRSIFKFLRPGSRKQQPQVRSISSPVLRTRPSQASGLYDGPSDDPSLLTVQYELTDNPQHGGRSASVGHLMPHRKDTMAHLAVPGMIQRRPSLADYERSLTAAGDDRRRPSAVNLQKLQEVQEDDRRQSLQIRRKLSRAKPLASNDEPATGLMAQALEKHQQEKALFRSASKQRESLGTQHDQPKPLFRTDTLTASGTRLSAPDPAGQYDLHDPFERPGTKTSSGRGYSGSHLIPSGPPVPGSSRYASTSVSFNTAASRRASSMAVPPGSAERPSMAQRIGTTLDAWSRFPSHSRPERCASAGKADAVITRDFAVDVSPEDFDDIEDDELDVDEGKKAAKTHSKRLPKRRSTMFNSMKNYYSNMFSSSGSNTAQNRRSSVSAGGWLANPDLELLPPTSSHEPTFPHHDHPFKQRLQELEQELEDAVRRDVGFVEEEAHKFEREVRKDAGYVEKEAEIIERHLRKDVEFVEEEAEKLTHHQLHHQHPVPQANAGSHLFREDGLFADGGHPHLKRDSTFMGPLDEATAEDPLATDHLSGTAERNVSLDGAGSAPSEPKKLGKAEVWSDVYKECLTVAEPDDAEEGAESTPLLCLDGAQGHAMEPPSLRPVKARSPEQPKRLDPKASIRRFPSVTVVDDRKGHSRSVSLISVKVDGGGIFRSSTNDLLQLIQAREEEEREKLLQGIDNSVPEGLRV
ncbi:hypothetical protein LTR85_006916 [Meristemomyces frigidus]|nr:hypothetical protein LTR85_006916 [Meristemomyces frigidus]